MCACSGSGSSFAIRRAVSSSVSSEATLYSGCPGLTIASLASAHMLDVASRDTNSNLYAFFSVKPGAGASPGIDYTPTATIRKQAGQVLLDPCTGKPK